MEYYTRTMKTAGIGLLLIVLAISLLSCSEDSGGVTPSPYEALFAQWEPRGNMVLSNASASKDVHIQFSNDNASIRFELVPNTTPGTLSILSHLRDSLPATIASSVDAANLLLDVNLATETIAHYELTADYLRLNLAGIRGGLTYQFIAEFRADGTYKAVAMGSPSVTPSTSQTPYDTDLGHNNGYMFELTIQ